MSSTIQRPALHNVIHASVLGKRERSVDEEEAIVEEWNTEDESTEDESDYSVCSDEDDSDEYEHSILE